MSSNWLKNGKIPLANVKFYYEQSPGVQGWTQMPVKKGKRIIIEGEQKKVHNFTAL